MKYKLKKSLFLIFLICCTSATHNMQEHKENTRTRCTVTTGSALNQGARKKMTDCVCVQHINHLVCAAVFDGHRGAYVSQELEKTLIPSLLEKISTERNYGKAIELTFKEVNKKIYQNKSIPKNSGAAAAVVLIDTIDNTLYCSHVGNTRVVNNSGTPLTQDHTCNNPDEKERVNKKNICLSDKNSHLGGMSSLTRSFGNFFLEDLGMTAQPEIRKEDIKAGSTHLIIASDGIWDVIENDEAAQLVTTRIQQKASLNRIAQECILIASKRGLYKTQGKPLENTALNFFEKISDAELKDTFARADNKQAHDNQAVVIVNINKK